jgi:hypothetical protein
MNTMNLRITIPNIPKPFSVLEIPETMRCSPHPHHWVDYPSSPAAESLGMDSAIFTLMNAPIGPVDPVDSFGELGELGELRDFNWEEFLYDERA